MTLLTAAEYPSIRRAIDPSLDTTLLPDAVIADPIYLGEAERVILARAPESATADDPELTAFVRACIYLTAALIAPALPYMTSETTDVASYRYARDPKAAAENGARLLALYEGALATATGAALALPFALARGCRP